VVVDGVRDEGNGERSWGGIFNKDRHGVYSLERVELNLSSFLECAENCRTAWCIGETYRCLFRWAGPEHGTSPFTARRVASKK